MIQPLSQRQTEIVARAGRLADIFAQRADTFDRANAFPLENFEDMRREGYLGLTVPAELGGAGASLLDLVLAQERLAMGDGSTALAVNMHLSPIGQWSTVWRDTRDAGLEQLLRDAASGDVIWASLTAERGVENNLMDATTTAEVVDGGYRINGSKVFCTNSVAATHVSFTARLDDPVLGSRIGLFRAAKDSPGFTFVPTWDALGMRATQSNDLVIDDVLVPPDSLVHSVPVNHFDHRILRTVWAWAMPTFGAVYLGIAAGAMQWARDAVLARDRQDDPLVQASFAEMEIMLESGRATIFRHCDDVMAGRLFELPSVQAAVARCALAKVIPCNNAVNIFTHVADVVGGPAFMRRFPVERMWRDVQAGPIMPLNRHQAQRLLGATSLGVQIAPEVQLVPPTRAATTA